MISVKMKRLTCKEIRKMKIAKTTPRFNRLVISAETKLGRKLRLSDFSRKCSK